MLWNWVEAIKTAIRYVEDHLEGDCLTTEAVADAVHISSFHFQRGFSVVCGITLSEYIRNRRLSLAGRDLQVEGNKVIDIALKYGYNDCFRNTFRIFPMSETRLIPDLYHIVQHLLILLNIIICLVGC